MGLGAQPLLIWAAVGHPLDVQQRTRCPPRLQSRRVGGAGRGLQGWGSAALYSGKESNGAKQWLQPLLPELPGSHLTLGEAVSSEIYYSPPELALRAPAPADSSTSAGLGLLRENKADQRVTASFHTVPSHSQPQAQASPPPGPGTDRVQSLWPGLVKGPPLCRCGRRETLALLVTTQDSRQCPVQPPHLHEGLHAAVNVLLAVHRRDLDPDPGLALGDHGVAKPDDKDAWEGRESQPGAQQSQTGFWGMIYSSSFSEDHRGEGSCPRSQTWDCLMA